MQAWCEVFCGGPYAIDARLKEIDGGYFVARNKKNNRFEIHHSAQAGSTLALVVPYAELDARTVELVRRTRVERMEAELRRMDAYNAALEERNRRGIQEEAWEKAMQRREEAVV